MNFGGRTVGFWGRMVNFWAAWWVLGEGSWIPPWFWKNPGFFGEQTRRGSNATPHLSPPPPPPAFLRALGWVWAQVVMPGWGIWRHSSAATANVGSERR